MNALIVIGLVALALSVLSQITIVRRARKERDAALGARDTAAEQRDLYGEALLASVEDTRKARAERDQARGALAHITNARPQARV